MNSSRFNKDSEVTSSSIVGCGLYLISFIIAVFILFAVGAFLYWARDNSHMTAYIAGYGFFGLVTLTCILVYVYSQKREKEKDLIENRKWLLLGHFKDVESVKRLLYNYRVHTKQIYSPITNIEVCRFYREAILECKEYYIGQNSSIILLLKKAKEKKKNLEESLRACRQIAA